MTQTFAYGIGAVFLAVACLLWASSARALFSREFSGAAKAVAIAALLALCAMGAYRILPTLRWDLPASSSAITTPPAPPAAAPVRRPPPPRPATVPRPFVGIISGLDPAPVTTEESTEVKAANREAAQPVAPVVESAAPETVNVPEHAGDPRQPGRPKRLIDSTRRMLHLGHRKYQPGAQATGQE